MTQLRQKPGHGPILERGAPPPRHPFESVADGDVESRPEPGGGVTSIERTASPRFKRLITEHELHLLFTPSRDEVEWAAAPYRL